MKNTSTLIVPAKQAGAIVPKPSKAQIIKAIAQELLEQNTIQADIINKQKERLAKKVVTEIRKAFRTAIKTAPLSELNWYLTDDEAIRISNRDPVRIINPALRALIQKMNALQAPSTYLPALEKEVADKMESEMVNMIRNQPGMKDAIASSLIALGLSAPASNTAPKKEKRQQVRVVRAAAKL